MQHQDRSKLSLEDKESLQELLGTDVLKALLRLIQLEQDAIVSSVISFDLGAGGEQAERELIHRKCRAEGAIKLALNVKTRLESLKPKQKA